MRKFNLFVFCGHCIVGAVLLGSGINIGFIVDQWFSPVFGYGSGVGYAVAFISGALIGLGSYGLFIHSERALKTILRLEEWERIIRIVSLILLNVGFVALGVAGLLYRLSFLNTKGVGFLVVIGIILEVSTPIFGIVMHPLQNPDSDVLEEERMHNFTRDTMHDAWDAMDNLPTHQRMRALGSGGMDDVLDEAVESIDLKPKKAKPLRIVGPISNRMSRRLEPSPTPPTIEVEEEEEGELPNPFLETLQKKNKR